MSPKQWGFTLIELMLVVAIIAMLGTLALPAYQDRIIRGQVQSGVELTAFARTAVEEYYQTYRRLPADNAAAGLPPAARIVGNHVSAVTVENGGLQVRYGNRANQNLQGKTVSLRPARVAEYPQVPLAWVCGTAPIPNGMQADSPDRTDLPVMHLPLDCRP